MAIKTKLSTGTIDILAADTVLFEVDTAERIGVSAFSCFSSAATDVTFYSSPNDTSASGKVLAKHTFAIDEEIDISAVIGLGFSAGQRIIAVGAATGVNATLAFALYTGDDV